MEAWYTFYTKPNAEYQVAAVLQQRGVQTYLPEIETAEGHRRRNKKPFFPCYLFVKIDFEIFGLAYVHWTPGLRRVVAFGNQPVSLPDKIIELMKRNLDEHEVNGSLPTHPFQPGDTLRITEGPFRDMLAIFDGPTKPCQRVQVLLDILGRASRMQVDVTDLEKVSSGISMPEPKRPRRTRGRRRRIKKLEVTT